MRQIVLDTETTGLEPQQGHKIIEIGGVELINRKPTGRHFHKYINPNREIDDGALEVHGITQAFLRDKPQFSEIADELVEFLRESELVIHNAPFDVSFLDYEFSQVPGCGQRIADLCKVTDSLALARHKHPGQKNNLDALCRRYGVDNTARQLHGALLDAEILADVYLAMTGGQTALFANSQHDDLQGENAEKFAPLPDDRPRLRVIVADRQELEAHEVMLDKLGGDSQPCVWRRETAAQVSSQGSL